MSGNEDKSIETNLFKWVDWDCIDTAIYQFHDVTLVADIGDLKKGSKFSLATINYEFSLMEFHDFEGEDGDGDPIERGKFSLRLEATPISVEA